MGNRRALLVGINYPGTTHELNGCVNDVNLMADVITEHYGFKDATQRRMLTDNSATTANILERLEWLVEGAQAGDVLYFHYSGHGSQMVDQTYDDDFEPDALDEIICPVDLNWRDKVIRDDDLKRIFDTVPDGVNLTVVLDCCNSGGGLDQLNQYQPYGLARQVIEANSPNKNRWLPMPDDIANRARGLELVSRDRTLQSRDVDSTGLLVSGCQSHQTSADAWIHDRYMGAATYYMFDNLRKHNWDVGYETLVNEMNNSMIQYGYTQRPELNGSNALFNNKFLQPMGVVSNDFVPVVTPVDEPEPVEIIEEAPAEVLEVEDKPTKKWFIYIGIGIACAVLYALATMT